jgi:hypothetical protein
VDLIRSMHAGDPVLGKLRRGYSLVTVSRVHWISSEFAPLKSETLSKSLTSIVWTRI